MNTLEEILVNTYNPSHDLRLAAERALAQFLVQPGSCLQFLHLIGNHHMHRDLRLAAVIVLKNRVDDFWTNSQGLSIVVDEKFLFRQQIVETLLGEPENSTRELLSDIISSIALTDYPQDWPMLVPHLLNSIQTNHLNVQMVYNSLLALRKIVKRYEYKYGEQRKPLAAIIEDLFPVLQNTVLPAVVQSSQIEAAMVLKLCLKIFHSCTMASLPASTNVDAQAWFSLLCQMMEKSLPEPGEVGEPVGQPADVEEKKKWPWWKVKGGDKLLMEFG
jgi:hypothetical protein